MNRPVVDLLYFEGCPNHEDTLELVERIAVEEAIDPELRVVAVTSAEEAEQLRFLGSPTVRVNGHDIEPAPTSGATSPSPAASTAPTSASAASRPRHGYEPRFEPSLKRVSGSRLVRRHRRAARAERLCLAARVLEGGAGVGVDELAGLDPLEAVSFQ